VFKGAELAAIIAGLNASRVVQPSLAANAAYAVPNSVEAKVATACTHNICIGFFLMHGAE